MKKLAATTFAVLALASTGAMAQSSNSRALQFEIQLGTSDMQTAQNVPAKRHSVKQFYTIQIQNSYLATSRTKLQNIASNGGNTSAYDEPDCPPLPTQTCADSWKVKTINPFVQTINPFE